MLKSLSLLTCAAAVEHIGTLSLVEFFDILEINELQSLCAIGNC